MNPKVLFNCFTNGQVIASAEWKEDGTVTCPACRMTLAFDGEHFYDMKTGSYAMVVEQGEPHGHFFRYDLAHAGHFSERKRDRDVPWDWKKEFDAAMEDIERKQECQSM